MRVKEAIELLKGIQNPLQDYADMVCAPAFTHGHMYVYPEPEDYAIEEAIIALNEKQNRRWIPVSERMPEEGEAVLVQWEDYNRLTGDTDVYIDKMWRVNDSDGYVFTSVFGVINGKVVAWMPLPEVYRPE